MGKLGADVIDDLGDCQVSASRRSWVQRRVFLLCQRRLFLPTAAPRPGDWRRGNWFDGGRRDVPWGRERTREMCPEQRCTNLQDKAAEARPFHTAGLLALCVGRREWVVLQI